MLNKFVFLQEAESDKLYILQTSFPFAISLVSKYTEGIQIAKDWLGSKCPGYKVYISFHGFLDPALELQTEDDVKFVRELLQEKAMFYYDCRIHRSPTKFHKYKD